MTVVVDALLLLRLRVSLDKRELDADERREVMVDGMEFLNDRLVGGTG